MCDFVIKRSYSFNDLSLFDKAESTSMNRTRSYHKSRNIRFATDIERICFFKKTDSPSRIASSQRYSISDLKSKVARWSIIDSNCENVRFCGESVTLESVKVEFHADQNKKNVSNFLVGQTLVRNLSFEKVVIVRYTIDSWSTFKENICNFGSTVTLNYQNFIGIDRFEFRIDLDQEFINMDRKLEEIFFCIRYMTADGKEFWDNNQGKNYHLILEHRVEKTLTPLITSNGVSFNVSSDSTLLDESIPESQFRYYSALKA